MADKPTKFVPSDNQKAVLKAFQAENYNCSVEAACEVAGLSRRSYYDWFDDCEGFTNWWQERADDFFAKRLPRVKGAMLASAIEHAGKGDKKYNPKAQELFLQRFDKGFVPRTHREINVKGSLGIDEGTTRKLLNEALGNAAEKSDGDDAGQASVAGES